MFNSWWHNLMKNRYNYIQKKGQNVEKSQHHVFRDFQGIGSVPLERGTLEMAITAVYSLLKDAV